MFLRYTKKRKRGASLLLVPLVKAFALPKLSKRAMLKAPRECVYNSPSLPTNTEAFEANEGCI